jgi:hypothetical protein
VKQRKDESQDILTELKDGLEAALLINIDHIGDYFLDPVTTAKPKLNQNNEWHLQDNRGGNNFPYVRIKK